MEGVSPVMCRTPVDFARSGGTLSELTGGRFIEFRPICTGGEVVSPTLLKLGQVRASGWEQVLPISWMLETSAGEVQGGYLLKESTKDIGRAVRH